MKKKYLILAMAIAAPLAFVGCGGGGGSSDGGTTPTTSTGVVFGKIDGFGSILIANRRLTTDDNTEVVIGDDNPKVWDDNMKTDGTLQAGQIAFVLEDNGHADRITVDENVKGPVDGANPLVVMGQTVTVGAGTVDDSCPTNLANAEVIEVYGLVDDTGAINANIIECKTRAEVNRYSVIGPVTNLSGNTFQINGLTVDFSNANTDDLFGGQPQEGQLVQVKDDNRAYNGGANDTLFATKVEPQVSAGVLGSPDDHLEIESFVTDASGAPNSFKMGDLTINISASTTFLFGDVSLIVNGVKLEAEGHINSSGELDATKIKFEDNDSRVDGYVSAVDPGSKTISLLGGSVTVGVDDSTEIELDSGGTSLNDITAGDSLEVRGYIGANGVFVASEIDTGSEKIGRAEIRSTATSINVNAVNPEPSMVILGIDIVTDTNTQYRDHNDQPMLKADFFAALVENVTTVQAKWRSSDDNTVPVDLSAPVIELELEDD